MGKTSTQRSRERRQRIRDDPEAFQSYKDAEKFRQAKLRKIKRGTMSESEKRRERDRVRERVKACRQRRKMQAAGPEASTRGFQSRQALGKACARVRRSLPGSPSKRARVAEHIVAELGIGATATRGEKRHSELEGVVRAFYERDDISRAAPGKKDFITLRSPGGSGKSHVQKRHLFSTVYETYTLFKEEFPEAKVGKSKFVELRPKHVLTTPDVPKNVCLCQTHENVNLLVTAIGKHIPGFPKTEDLASLVVCDTSSTACMLTQDCSHCSSLVKFDALVDSVGTDDFACSVNVYQWEPLANGRMGKQCCAETLDGALELLRSQLPAYLCHVLTKRRQSAYFERAKHSLSTSEAVIQVDFAENYTTHYQDEVQSAHWCYNQVTLFTCVCYVMGGHRSHVVISDYLEHNKYAVYDFLNTILEDLKEAYPAIESVVFFSDGAASQFKQRFLLGNLSAIRATHNLAHLEWNFFATSHGKGAVDGLGGTLKRIVARVVNARAAVVQDAKSFLDAAQSHTSVKLSLRDQASILARKSMLDDVWENFRSLPGTHGVHHVVATADTSKVEYSRLSVGCPMQEFSFVSGTRVPEAAVPQQAREPHPQAPNPVPVADLRGGDEVACRYDGQWYVGVVLRCLAGETLVNFMGPPGPSKGFKWPSVEDSLWVKEADILSRITLTHSSRVSCLPEADQRRLTQLLDSTLA